MHRAGKQAKCKRMLLQLICDKIPKTNRDFSIESQFTLKKITRALLNNWFTMG